MANEKDPNPTVSLEADSADLDAALSAAFGREKSDSPAESRQPQQGNLSDISRVMLRETEFDVTDPIERPQTDEIPPPSMAPNRYQLHGEIARGGMGVIIKGRDCELGRELAIKILLGKHAAKPDVTQRFVEEAQIGGQLQHPGIVPVYDIGQFSDNRPFFTMKLVKGKTLSAMLAERGDTSTDRTRFLTIFEQVCQTMAYAHSRGVIHRDLKPANVMVGAFGQVQVMDWGLAKVLTEGGVADERKANAKKDDASVIRTVRSEGSDTPGFGSETHAGSVMGTPAYMSPEQAQGEVDLLDERADVFGLGAILCVILSGGPPYQSDDPLTVMRKATGGYLFDAHQRLDESGADNELIELAKSCLSAEPGRRPRNASVVADHLASYLASVDLRLRNAELQKAQAQTKAEEESKRRRVTIALAVSVILTLILGGVAWSWIAYQRTHNQRQLSKQIDNLELQINNALGEALLFKNKAETNGLQDLEPLRQAEEAARRAESLTKTGRVEQKLADKVRATLKEISEATRDHDLLSELEQVRSIQAEVNPLKGQFATDLAIPGYTQAFRRAGIEPEKTDPLVAADWIRSRAIATQQAMIDSLDHWILIETEYAGHPSRRKWLFEVVRNADSDVQRAEVRRLVDKQDWQNLIALSQEPQFSSQAATTVTTVAAWLCHAEMADSAISLLQQAQQIHPGDFWINTNLGILLAQSNDPEYEEAIRHFTAALALRPGNAGAYLNLGAALRAAGRSDEAIPALRKATTLEPGFAKAHSNLGAALVAERQLDQALVSHRKAIALNPDFDLGYQSLGLALLAKRDVGGAIGACRKAIELNPHRAANYHYLGVMHAEQGDFKAAIVAYRKALELKPHLPETLNNLGLAFKSKGDLQEAGQSLKKSISLRPRAPEAHKNLGELFMLENEIEQAIQELQTAIELNPRFAEAYDSLGLALRKMGEIEAGFACHKKSIELNPQNARVYNNLGLAMLEANHDLDNTILVFKKAIELQPELAEVHMSLGLALRKSGKLIESRDAIARGREIGFRRPDRIEHAEQMLEEAEQLVELNERLPRILAGQEEPATAYQQAQCAAIAYYQRLFRSSTRSYEEAFAEDEELLEDTENQWRYNAACAASLAAAGSGLDADNIDDDERQRLRLQAISWLQDELAFYARQLEIKSADSRRRTRRMLRYWLRDTDLISIREKQQSEHISVEEMQLRDELWGDVNALLLRASK